MMSRKHYNAIAEAIAEVRQIDGIPTGAALLEVQSRLTEIFAEDNPQFSAGRFNAACFGLK